MFRVLFGKLRGKILGRDQGGSSWNSEHQAVTQRGATRSRSRSDQWLIAAGPGLTTRNQRSAIASCRTRQFGHDSHCYPAGRHLTVSGVAKIQLVRPYSPGSEEHRIDNNRSDNEQHRRQQQCEESRFRAPAEEEAVPQRKRMPLASCRTTASSDR